MKRIADILSPSVRNVGKLLSANVVAQAIGLLVYPILTRLYAPENFALLNLFTSIASVIALFATFEYHYAIVLPKEEEKAISLVHLCFLILAGVLAVTCLSIPFASPIATLFKAPDLARYWWMLPFLVAGIGIWNILNYWYIRRTAFSRISGYQVTQSIFSAAGKIGLGVLGWLNCGLIVASVLAPLLALLTSACLAWKRHLRMLLTRSKDIPVAAKEYANFPKFSLPRALVNAVSVSLPVWILTPHFGLEQVGYLSLAMMAAVLPFSLFARACYQVLFQVVTEKVQQQKAIGNLVSRFIILSGSAMIVILLAVYFILPQMVTVLFGAQWIESAAIIRALYPYLLLTPICGTICFLSDVFGKQKIAMWLEIGYLLLMATALCTGIYFGSFIGTVQLFAWTRLIYLSIQLLWFISLVRKYDTGL